MTPLDSLKSTVMHNSADAGHILHYQGVFHRFHKVWN